MLRRMYRAVGEWLARAFAPGIMRTTAYDEDQLDWPLPPEGPARELMQAVERRKAAEGRVVYIAPEHLN